MTEHVRGVDVRDVLSSLAASSDRALHGQPRPWGNHDHQRQEDPLLQHSAGSGGQREVRATRFMGWTPARSKVRWYWSDMFSGVGRQGNFGRFVAQSASPFMASKKDLVSLKVFKRPGGTDLWETHFLRHLRHHSLSRPTQLPGVHWLRAQPDLPGEDLHLAHVSDPN